jgi:hypothetical protein
MESLQRMVDSLLEEIYNVKCDQLSVGSEGRESSHVFCTR